MSSCSRSLAGRLSSHWLSCHEGHGFWDGDESFDIDSPLLGKRAGGRHCRRERTGGLGGCYFCACAEFNLRASTGDRRRLVVGDNRFQLAFRVFTRRAAKDVCRPRYCAAARGGRSYSCGCTCGCRGETLDRPYRPTVDLCCARERGLLHRSWSCVLGHVQLRDKLSPVFRRHAAGVRLQQRLHVWLFRAHSLGGRSYSCGCTCGCRGETLDRSYRSAVDLCRARERSLALFWGIGCAGCSQLRQKLLPFWRGHGGDVGLHQPFGGESRFRRASDWRLSKRHAGGHHLLQETSPGGQVLSEVSGWHVLRDISNCRGGRQPSFPLQCFDVHVDHVGGGLDRISGGGRFVESLLSRALDLQVVRFTQSARILSVVCQELQLSSFVVAQNLCRTAWSRSCLPSGGIYKTDIRRAFAFGDQLAQTCAREGSGLLWRHFRRDWARFNRDKLTGLYGSQTRTGFNRDRLTGLYGSQTRGKRPGNQTKAAACRGAEASGLANSCGQTSVRIYLRLGDVGGELRSAFFQAF